MKGYPSVPSPIPPGPVEYFRSYSASVLRDRRNKPHIWMQNGLWCCGWTRGSRRRAAGITPAAAFYYFTECMQ